MEAILIAVIFAFLPLTKDEKIPEPKERIIVEWRADEIKIPIHEGNNDQPDSIPTE